MPLTEGLFTVDNRAGRLLESTMRSHMSMQDAQRFRTRLWTLLSGVSGKGVICADLREAEILVPEVADSLSEMLRHDNLKLERSAYVIRAGGVFSMQVERLINEASTAAVKAGRAPPLRQTFRDPAAAVAFLDEVLTEPAERARVRIFLGVFG